jgi:DNA-binding beta-propeller fold protein YncE
LVLLALAACSGGSLAPPTSDNKYDDPCDPGGGPGNIGAPPPVDAGAALLALPAGPPGIGLDDLRMSGTLSLLLVPAGRSGNLDLVDPSSEVVQAVGGFSAEATFGGDDTFGVTSADEAAGIVYAVDRTTSSLSVVDPRELRVVASTSLLATPGYVRYVAATTELWVTEPAAQQIEVLALGSDASAAPGHAAVIAVPGGPESLVVDPASKRAYTHAGTMVVAIDVTSRTALAQWSNGCATSRGLAVDSARGWVISACEEGRVAVLDEQGAALGSTVVAAGVDQVAYDASSTRLYVPGAAAAAMSVVMLGSSGAPQVLGSVQVASDSHCAVAAGGGSVYVCAPSQGALLFVRDPF